MTDRDKCVARRPLIYGSTPCLKPAKEHSDLCAEHAALIHPQQLINGVFYVHEEDDDD